MKKNLHFAWLVLVGLCVMVGIGKAGLNNTAGLFVSQVSEDIGTGVGTLTLYISISSIVTMLFLPIGGKIMAKYNTQFVLVTAIILQAGSFAMFGLMNAVWGWYIFAVPLAVGGVFITVIAGPVMIERWFNKKNGMALGIMTAMAGLFGAVIQPVVGQLISGIGWRDAYLAVGIGAAVIVIPAILLLLRQNPESKGLRPYGSEVKEEGASDEGKRVEGITFKDANKSAAFYLLGLFFFIATAVTSFSVNIPQYLESVGYSVEFAGVAMSSMMVGVFIGSLLFGYLIDRMGAKFTALLAIVMGAVSFVLLWMFPSIVVLVFVALFIFGFFSASIGTIAPAVTSALFGGREYSQIYSTASMGLAVASVIALPAYGYIFDWTGSYFLAFIIILVMLAVSFLAILGAFANKRKLVNKGFWSA